MLMIRRSRFLIAGKWEKFAFAIATGCGLNCRRDPTFQVVNHLPVLKQEKNTKQEDGQECFHEHH